MVKFELGNGKTVMLSLEDYLDMTDESYQKLMADNAGVVINDPFCDLDGSTESIDIEPIDRIADDIPKDEVEKIKKEIKKENDDFIE